jgi:diguanylate cyclase (GGDEF)-like protein
LRIPRLRFNPGAESADKPYMRLRFWIGLAAVAVIAFGSVGVALAVHANDSEDFHTMQQDEATRAAHQAESVAGLSVGELSNAAAFFQVEKNVNRHEFDVVARSLLDEGALNAAAFIQRVPAAARSRFERSHGIEIIERGGPAGRLVRAADAPIYFPLTYAVAHQSTERGIGFNLASDPLRSPYLRRARDTGKPAATGVVPLLLGDMGVAVFRPVYRDGAPLATVAQRRAALVGFAAGSFKVEDLAAAAIGAVSGADAVQLRVGNRAVVGPEGELEDAAKAPLKIADRTWLLVVRDPKRPDVSLPLLLGGVGISVAALLGALILVWSRNERIQELQREASQDPLTSLKNRRRFNEDLERAMARARRERTTGAVLMLDLDYFKQVNDSHGHPAGDSMIKEVADVLRRRSRSSDTLARLGGDEFAVVLPRCTAGEAQLAAEGIAKAIREHRPQDGGDPVTASVGVAMFGDHARSSIASVVSEADSAMYAAKDGGRDGVRVFDPVAIRGDAATD